MPQDSFPWTGQEAPTFAEIRDKPATFPPPAATATVIGGVKAAAAQVNSTAPDVATLVTNFNTLLTNLRASGAILP